MNNSKIDYEQAKKEYISILLWANKECDKVLERLNQEGKLVGLDSQSDEFAYIHDERKKRVAALYDKYRLPSDTKLIW